MAVLKRLLKLEWKFFINLKILKVLFAGMITLLVTLWSSNYYIHLDDTYTQKVMFYALSVFLGMSAFSFNLLILGEYRDLKSFLKALKGKK